MGISIEMTKAFMDTKGMKYEEIDNGNGLIVGIGGLKNKGSVDSYVFFVDESSVTLKVFDVCQIPEGKREIMFKVCSQMNEQFRWVKFYVDKQALRIVASDDAVIQPDSCGEEIFGLLLRMANVIDAAYPHFMQAMWS